MNSPKKLPIWVKLIGGLILIVIVSIGSLLIFMFSPSPEEKRREKIIDKKFHEEIAQVPELKIESFRLWEGDSLVQATVEGMGSVTFWYGISSVPHINAFDGYWVLGKCFYVNDQDEREEYAFDQSLVLDKDSELKKWFPFEVNNLQDLVDRYSEIAEILDKFPTNPEMVEMNNVKKGKREIVKDRNPEYILEKQFEGKKISCDLYRYR